MSALRPSFFELLAVEQLNSSLRPALSFALELLSSRHGLFDFLSFQTDEVYCVLATALELASLRRDAATLSEGFYTLRRSRAFDNNIIHIKGGMAAASGALPPRAVLQSLFFAVLLPYLRRKLDAKYDLERGRTLASSYSAVSNSSNNNNAAVRRRRETTTTTNNHGNNLDERSGSLSYRSATGRRGVLGLLYRIVRIIFNRATFLTLYPLITTTSDLVALIYKVAYLLEGTRYYTPALALQRLVLRRLTPVEVSSGLGMGNGILPFGVFNLPPAQTYLQKAMRLGDTFSTALKYSLFAALVAYRFGEYYRAAQEQQPSNSNNSIGEQAAVVIPPPQVLPPASGFELPASNDECPLCSKKRVNASALAVSGYVFCYQCILDYVRVNEKCPVTNLRANRADICRVYHEQ